MNKTRYCKIPTREMVERLNYGQETFVEYYGKKYAVVYGSYDRYIVFKTENSTHKIAMSGLFDYFYYVKL
jgi:hypothetical protein